MPLGEILRLNIQLDLVSVRPKEWRRLRTEATQHLSDVFQKEKVTLATMVGLKAQLAEAEVAREEAERKVGANEAPPRH